jgi:hypothetical protein
MYKLAVFMEQDNDFSTVLSSPVPPKLGDLIDFEYGKDWFITVPIKEVILSFDENGDFLHFTVTVEYPV